MRDIVIAALFVETGGSYYGLPEVDPWDAARDARSYTGPWPIVAHPPCERWGRYWHGSPRKPHQYQLGDDKGCFASALRSVRQYGGVLEHPAHSHAWKHFDLGAPPKMGGWVPTAGGWTCHIEQGFYGHFSNKPTWLYTVGTELSALRWGRGKQRLDPVHLAKHGYEKARRCDMIGAVGGKYKKQIRNATPPAFRDLLIALARSCR